MFQVIKPLGDLVTTLPAGPEYPGRTVGPSFELFYESDYVLPHREAAWILLTERIGVAAEFCEPAAPCDPAVADRLATVRSSLTEIAQALAARLPARDVRLPAGNQSPAGDLSTLLARAEDFYRTGTGFTPHDDELLSGLAALLRSAYQVIRSPSADARLVARLVNSVLRPLTEAGLSKTGNPGTGNPGTVLSGTVLSGTGPSPASLLDLAVAATALRARLGANAPSGLLEAVAALQDLAVRQAPPGERAQRIAALDRLQGSLPAAIVTATNGPYLVTNVPTVRTPLGERLPLPPQLALCRCGGSSMKPFCDGTHASNGFTDAKDPHRVADQRDTYPGQQVTIFDNRGICQHSGLCTDRLATVFRADKEPFVAPSGGRLDEIVRAVRDCPSGALSLAFDGEEARALADWNGERERAIEITQDGPYRVTGAIPLADAAGADVARAAGSSREHYALCRCGHSQNKPFCSGMHWYVEFRDPVRSPGSEPTLFEWAGGLPGLTRMTRLLYEKQVPADEVLAPLFATMAPGYPQREAAVLAAAFGGPALSGDAAQRPGFTEEQRARWVMLATAAADEAGLPADPEFRAALASYLDWSSRAGTQSHPAGPPPQWDWSPAGPPAEVPAQASPASHQDEVTLPGPDEAVSFAANIKPMFREHDRKSMTFAFDLWSLADVKAHAAEILERLGNGTMPCDGAWPPEKIEVFRRWTETGFQP